jgi:hypothetical protein
MSNSPLSNAVQQGFNLLIEENDSREIGKFLAYTTEKVIVPQWLESACSVQSHPSNDENKQQATYDRITNNKVRLQVKFRGGKTLHMEQTRRTTGKNSNKGAKNGQVRYDVNSFDVALFVIPTNYTDPSSWEYLAIPAYELEDPKMPGYCVGTVPKSIQTKYKNQAIQVIKTYESL